jgi:hypothetical protein
MTETKRQSERGGSGTPDLSKLEPEKKEMKRKKDEG